MRSNPIPIHLALLVLGLSACAPSGQPPTPAKSNAAAPADAQAAKTLELYREMRRAQSYELALPLGQELVAKFPGSAAATEVQQTLADTAAKAKQVADKRRLTRLWAYQSGTESGGTQNTAAIYSSQPAAEAERIRLVLRRHSDWGESVYLFGSGAGFECANSCTLAIRFDDKPAQRFKAYLPKTGEPAIFIEDERGFIAKMEKAQKLALDVTLKGKGKRSLLFEVGGYDPAKYPPLPRK